MIDEILDADKTAPPKQRHTARRIFERLRDEYGYTGCYSQVQTAVAHGQALLEGGLRPALAPAGPCPVRLRRGHGRDRRRARARPPWRCITLPYSDAYFLSAYPRECTETFQAAHVAGVRLLRRGAGADLL